MAQLVPMPQLGSTMEEGTIIKWRLSEGDPVRKGETLLEIETDKATMEVEAPADGVIRKLLYGVDSVVPIQKPIAIIGTPDEPIDHLLGGAALVEAKLSGAGCVETLSAAWKTSLSAYKFPAASLATPSNR